MGLQNEDSVGTLLPVTQPDEVLRKDPLYDMMVDDVYGSMIEKINEVDEGCKTECGGCTPSPKLEGDPESDFKDVLAQAGISSVMKESAENENIVELWGDPSEFLENCDVNSPDYKKFAGVELFEESVPDDPKLNKGDKATLMAHITMRANAYCKFIDDYMTAWTERNNQKLPDIINGYIKSVPSYSMRYTVELIEKKKYWTTLPQLLEIVTRMTNAAEKCAAMLRVNLRWLEGHKKVIQIVQKQCARNKLKYVIDEKTGSDIGKEGHASFYNIRIMCSDNESGFVKEMMFAAGIFPMGFFEEKDDKLEGLSAIAKLEHMRKQPKVFMEAAKKIDDDMSYVIDILHEKGYKTTASCAGHPNARVKEDGKRDGVLYDKLYSTARVVFNKEYKFKNIPTMWEGRKLPDGKFGIYVKAPNYRISQGMPEDHFIKWKETYMKSLRTWANGLPKAENLVTEEAGDPLQRMMDDLMLESMIDVI